MTEDQDAQLKKDVLYSAYAAGREAKAFRLRLAIIGSELNKLGRALEHYPERISKIPDPTSPYDYTDGIKLLQRGKYVLELCEELRVAGRRAEAAKRLVNGL